MQGFDACSCLLYHFVVADVSTVLLCARVSASCQKPTRKSTFSGLLHPCRGTCGVQDMQQQGSATCGT